MTATYLLLVRHGQNDWVRSNRLAGRTPGVYLNDTGKAQADRLAQELADLPISAVYSSPLERCMQTAQPTAAALGLDVQVEEGVIESDFGEWQGRKIAELSKLPEWHTAQDNPSTFRFPGGEDFPTMQYRAVQALKRLQQQHPDQAIAVFSHADIIRVCMAHYLGTPLDLFQRIMVSTASVSAVMFGGQKPMVLYVNRTADLPTIEFKQDDKEEASNSKS